MEYLLTASILFLGYQLQTNKNNKINKKFISSVPKSQEPSVQNTYTSKRAYNIFQEEQKKADILQEKSLYPQDTNIVVPGPVYNSIYNKVDYADKNLPIEFNSYQKYDDIIIDNREDINKNKELDFNLIKNNKSLPDSGGFNGISLTGDPINPDKFFHNNMQPFFGSSVKTNTDEFSTRGIFENFTGTQDNYKKKQEMGLLFEPQKNMSNVYGTGSLDGFMLDRYYVSNIRSNETPIEKVYVGPGLNQGYTNEPSGGFQQPDALEYATPKTTDEIRVKTNPKISYYGRIVSGSKIAKPGKVGTLYKNRPDTFYVQEPDRYFTTTGAVIAQEQRPCIVTKYTNRKTTELKTRTGSAAPVHGTVAQIRSKYKISDKITYADNGPRNINGTGTWNIIKNMLGFKNDIPNDYGKNSIRIRNNKRILNNNNNNNNSILNIKNPIEKGTSRINQKLKNTKKNEFIKNNRSGNIQGGKKSKIYDPSDLPRATIKETNIHNNHSGMMGPSIQKGSVYNPNDITRTTIKETNIHNNHSGMMGSSLQKGSVYDPNDITRTTIKETNIHNNHNGMLGTSMQKGSVYDPNDITRTTIKETNIHNNHNGMMGPSMQKGSVYDPNDITRTTIKETNIYNEYNSNLQNINRGNVVYDPNDITRTTIKETNIHNNYSGVLTKNAPSRGIVYDPENKPRITMKETTVKNKRKGAIGNSTKSVYVKNMDKPRNTMKQTTMVNNAMGIATQTRGDGHLVKEIQVPNTIREFTSVEYTGDAIGPELGAYDIIDVEATNTMRQFTSDIEYFGSAGNDGANTKPMSYEDVYNAEMKVIRSITDKGYTPNPGGVNEILDSNNIHMTTNKIGDIQNKYLNERGTQANKVYNSIPQINISNISQVKEIVPNEPLADRINPDILSAFKENPYTQSINSWA